MMRRCALVGIGVASLLAAGIASAELQRVEAVGSYGIREKLRTKVIARDAAIEDALWEGVSRVALDVVSDRPVATDGLGEVDARPDMEDEGGAGTNSTQSGDREEIETLHAALGKNMLPYTRSFQIQQDLGEQDVLFPESPDVRSEYVVVVEVLVDVDRVTEALERAGLVAQSSETRTSQVRVELLGLGRYPAYARVVDALRSQLHATAVQPVEFSPERQVLLVEGPFEPDEVSRWLADWRDDRLVLEPLGVDEAQRRVRVVGSWLPDPGNAGTRPQEH